jgi:hypothetical protein
VGDNSEQDKIHIRPNKDGDFVISRNDSDGEVTITPQHLINLAKLLPGLARQVLQELHGPRSSKFEAISGMHVEKISIQHDLLGETVLLQMTDKEGMESAFVLALVDAKRMGNGLLEIVAKAEESAQKSKQ